MPAKDRNKRYKRIGAKCPYYKDSAPSKTRCEGVERLTITLSGETRAISKNWEDRFCCSDFQRCPFYHVNRDMPC